MRGLELWRYSVRLQAISSRAAEERDGWMGGEGHLRPSASSGPTGSATARPREGRLAPRLFYSPEAESSGERFHPWGSARLQ